MNVITGSTSNEIKGVVARINIGDETDTDRGFFQWRKLVSDAESLLKYVNALSVSPDGSILAVHASDSTQSVLDAARASTDEPFRQYFGSAYSFIFQLSIETGDYLGKMVKI